MRASVWAVEWHCRRQAERVLLWSPPSSLEGHLDPVLGRPAPRAAGMDAIGDPSTEGQGWREA